jgi:hypothetical protein
MEAWSRESTSHTIRCGSMNDVGPASPFLVGRDAELAQLESVVDDVARRGGTVRIAGDPGVGKSALLKAGTELAVARGHTALTVRAAEGEAHLPSPRFTSSCGRFLAGSMNCRPGTGPLSWGPLG